MKRILAFALVTLSSLMITAPAFAGFVEIGGSGSYRKSNIDTDAYDESLSITGSLAYYFNEASAIELSYTDGNNKRSISENDPNGHITKLHYETLGFDFMYTLGKKESTIRPYLKIGTNYILKKRIIDQFRGPDGEWREADVREDEPGLVPSAGAGFRLGLTETLSLKIGVDGWSSRPLNKPPVTFDWFGRAGLSLLF